MEAHPRVNSIATKKLWKFLRETLHIMRKGVISKRKLIMEISLILKKGKLLRKTLTNLMFHHRRSRRVTRGGFDIQDYEFSCSNSPINPVFYHVPRRKKQPYFPCIKKTVLLDEDDDAEEKQSTVLLNFQCDPVPNFGPREKPSPLNSVMISNYSSDDENSDGRVDDEAEEFIRRFYDQLKAQSHIQLLQYQEMQYQEMIARGTC